uniref:Uncharacterized protein n=1 Tax=Parascaris univalens TaxID=6257 RepID=A0A915A8D7_PARUN
MSASVMRSRLFELNKEIFQSSDEYGQVFSVIRPGRSNQNFAQNQRREQARFENWQKI